MSEYSEDSFPWGHTNSLVEEIARSGAGPMTQPQVPPCKQYAAPEIKHDSKIGNNGYTSFANTGLS